MFIELLRPQTALRQEGNVYRMAPTQPPSARRAMFIELRDPSRPPPGGQCL